MDFSIGIEELFTIIPAVVALIVAIRNWLELRKGADIKPHRILSYGIVRDQTEDPKINNIYLPLIFHNEGTKVGMITKVEIISKIKLRELSKEDTNVGRQFVDMVDFEENGYIIQVPTYPISVPAGESSEAMFLSYEDKKQNIIPLDKKLTCIIKIEYGENRISEVKAPFILTKEDYEGTDYLRWFKPQSGNMREQFPADYQ
ncbi:MAG: hypothetical protein P8Y70_09025 [Candidatus Lokiarchaeota archaeon]